MDAPFRSFSSVTTRKALGLDGPTYIMYKRPVFTMRMHSASFLHTHNTVGFGSSLEKLLRTFAQAIHMHYLRLRPSVLSINVFYVAFKGLKRRATGGKGSRWDRIRSEGAEGYRKG